MSRPCCWPRQGERRHLGPVMAYPPGRVVLVRYDGDPTWHERLVLAHVDQSEFVICTPDFDLYLEQLDLRNDMLTGLRQYGPGGQLPAGVPAILMYGMAPMTLQEVHDLLVEGRTLSQAEGRGWWAYCPSSSMG